MKYSTFIFGMVASLFLNGCTVLDSNSGSADDLPEKEVRTLAEHFSLHRLCADRMVIQAGMPVRIAGFASPGAKVAVSLSSGKSSFLTRAAANLQGEWVATLPALPAGRKCQLIIRGKKQLVRLRDVCSGELWFCIGESDLAWPLFRCPDGEIAVRKSADPDLRFFLPPLCSSPFKTRNDLNGGHWELCRPETSGHFSAAAYFFGSGLRRRLKVPVGLICCGTASRIENWISPAVFLHSGRKKELQELDLVRKGSPEELYKRQQMQNFSAWERLFFQSGKKAAESAVNWKNADFPDHRWKKQTPAGLLEWCRKNDGVIWIRQTVTIPPDWRNRELTLELELPDYCDETYFNGVKIGATGTETPEYWKKKRLYQIPAALVRPGKAVIAVRIIDLGLIENGLILKPRTPKLFCGKKALPLSGIWRSSIEFTLDAKLKRKKIPSAAEKTQKTAGLLPPGCYFNGIAAPAAVIPVRGVLWYPGTGNLKNASEYASLFELFVHGLRKEWHNPKLPVIFPQLPAMRLPASDERENLPLLREKQDEVSQLPGCAMALTIDCREETAEKIGCKLAQSAWKLCYDAGGTGETAGGEGPRYQRMTVAGNAVTLHFSGSHSGLMVKNGQQPDGFTVAGTDGRFYPAKAVLQGNTVVLTSPEVKIPAAVRYGWEPFPSKTNVFDRAGNPLSPFRTDKVPEEKTRKRDGE